MTVDERNAKILNDAKVRSVDGGKAFSKSMPEEFNADNLLNIGDVIIIPAVLPTVYQRIFGSHVNAEGKTVEDFGEFIIVNVRDKDGKTRAFDFYPSSLTKNIWKAEKTSTGEVERAEGGPLHPKGSAVVKFLSFRGQTKDNKSDVQLGMEALLGKEIEITDKTPVSTQVWKNGEATNHLRTTNVLTYDLKE